MVKGTVETLYAQLGWSAALVLWSLYQCFLLQKTFKLGGQIHRWIHGGTLAGAGCIMIGAALCLKSSWGATQWMIGKKIWSLSTYAGGAMITAYVWLMLKAKYEGVMMQAEPPSIKKWLFSLWLLSLLTNIAGQTLNSIYKDEKWLLVGTVYYCAACIGIFIVLLYHSRILIAGLHLVLDNEQRSTAKHRWGDGLKTFKRRLYIMSFIFLAVIIVVAQGGVGQWKQGKTPRVETSPSPTNMLALLIFSLCSWSFSLKRKKEGATTGDRGRIPSLSPGSPGGKNTGGSGRTSKQPSREVSLQADGQRGRAPASTTQIGNSPTRTVDDPRQEIEMVGGPLDDIGEGSLGSIHIDVANYGGTDVLVMHTGDEPLHPTLGEKSDHEFQKLDALDKLADELAE